MKKDTWLKLVLAGSVLLNIGLLGAAEWKKSYTPNEEDKVLLGEMTRKVVVSEDFKEIEADETVYSIETGVNRAKGGVYPFHYEVAVLTDKQTHFFTCVDKTCAEVEGGGSSYSRYSEEEPMLPLK